MRHFLDMGYALEFDDTTVEDLTPGEPVELVDDEANYGHYTAIKTLGKRVEDGLIPPVVFVVECQEGSEYGPCVHACDGRRYAYSEADHDGFPCISMREDRALVGEAEARTYWDVHDAVYRRFARASKAADRRKAAPTS